MPCLGHQCHGMVTMGCDVSREPHNRVRAGSPKVVFSLNHVCYDVFLDESEFGRKRNMKYNWGFIK